MGASSNRSFVSLIVFFFPNFLVNFYDGSLGFSSPCACGIPHVLAQQAPVPTTRNQVQLT